MIAARICIGKPTGERLSILIVADGIGAAKDASPTDGDESRRLNRTALARRYRSQMHI